MIRHLFIEMHSVTHTSSTVFNDRRKKCVLRFSKLAGQYFENYIDLISQFFVIPSYVSRKWNAVPKRSGVQASQLIYNLIRFYRSIHFSYSFCHIVNKIEVMI